MAKEKYSFMRQYLATILDFVVRYSMFISIVIFIFTIFVAYIIPHNGDSLFVVWFALVVSIVVFICLICLSCLAIYGLSAGIRYGALYLRDKILNIKHLG